MLEKQFLQNCGSVLKVIEKDNSKKYSFKCIFLNYPNYEFTASKYDILAGKVSDSLAKEYYEFVNKTFEQKCGDTLVVLEKTTQKDSSNHHYLFRCKFLKYPCEVLVRKESILKREVLNPKIEDKFAGKIFKQKYGGNLEVLEKTTKKSKRSNAYLWKCVFLEDFSEVYALKSDIEKGNVTNIKLFPYLEKESLRDFILKEFTNKPSLQEISEKLNVTISTVGHYINNFELRDLVNYSYYGKEKEIQAFLSSNNIQFKSQNWITEKDKSFEVDILINNLGIEYNGAYWHSNLYKENNYHQKKSLFCLNKGIFLFHIFEYEWLEKQEIIKSLILCKNKIFDRKFYARQCNIKLLDNKTYQNFCIENHLQGAAGAKVKLGLYYKEELVQIMSFGTPRFTSDYDWEIIRECSKLNCTILGGKQKLWNYFVKTFNPKNCISYCDFSKFEGNSYLKLGFQKVRLNSPGFVWYDDNNKKVFWRTPSKHQEMKSRYLKIYDCGQLVFEWKNN